MTASPWNKRFSPPARVKFRWSPAELWKDLKMEGYHAEKEGDQGKTHILKVETSPVFFSPLGFLNTIITKISNDTDLESSLRK